MVLLGHLQYMPSFPDHLLQCSIATPLFRLFFIQCILSSETTATTDHPILADHTVLAEGRITCTVERHYNATHYKAHLPTSIPCVTHETQGRQRTCYKAVLHF